MIPFFNLKNSMHWEKKSEKDVSSLSPPQVSNSTIMS